MKKALSTLLGISAMIAAAHAADVTTTISSAHMCCAKCVNLSQKTVAAIPNVTAVSSQADSTIVLTGPDSASVQKATDALIAAGFFGKSSNPDIKITAPTGAKSAKVQTLDVTNVHLCCPKCVTAVNKACTAVPGVTATTAAVSAKTFTITGDFTDSDIFAALQKAGLTGKVGAP
jgi:copper chaperone CopZ